MKKDIIKKCKVCKKEFIAWSHTSKFCSSKCMGISMKGKMPKNLSLINANKKGSGNPMWGKTTSELQKKKARERVGILHPNWKGDDATSGAKHDWVERNKGKAREHKCEFCKKQAKEWCNIDHKYKRNLDHYLPVCRLCHEIFHKANGLRYKPKI